MLSQTTRYSFKALQLLAKNEGIFLSASHIAKACNIPEKFLEGILNDLRSKDLVISKLGRSGGYRLARRSAEITVADVIRASEGPIALLPCASKTYYQRCSDCPDEDKCALRSVVIEARDSMLAVFENRTLADWA